MTRSGKTRAQWNEDEKLKMRKRGCEKCGLGNEKTKETKQLSREIEKMREREDERIIKRDWKWEWSGRTREKTRD